MNIHNKGDKVHIHARPRKILIMQEIQQSHTQRYNRKKLRVATSSNRHIRLLPPLKQLEEWVSGVCMNQYLPK